MWELADKWQGNPPCCCSVPFAGPTTARGVPKVARKVPVVGVPLSTAALAAPPLNAAALTATAARYAFRVEDVGDSLGFADRSPASTIG